MLNFHSTSDKHTSTSTLKADVYKSVSCMQQKVLLLDSIKEYLTGQQIIFQCVESALSQLICVKFSHSLIL